MFLSLKCQNIEKCKQLVIILLFFWKQLNWLSRAKYFSTFIQYLNQVHEVDMLPDQKGYCSIHSHFISSETFAVHILSCSWRLNVSTASYNHIELLHLIQLEELKLLLYVLLYLVFHTTLYSDLFPITLEGIALLIRILFTVNMAHYIIGFPFP